MLQFKIEQIALCPTDPEAAIDLLSAMGLSDWVKDHVVALGFVKQRTQPYEDMQPQRNAADLAFNYEGFREKRELEVLHYTSGENWMQGNEGSASHLGMHCSHEELEEWKAFFQERSIFIVQEVNTWEHSNPVIAGKRWYHYCIFGTRHILGIDIKFIVRRNA